MTSGKGIKARSIMQMLSLSFKKEKLQWKPCDYVNSISMCEGTEVSGQQRDVVIKWLLELSDFLKFSPETIFTTTAIIDRFLHTVKAHPKYIYCIAISCFYVAIKITEEYEVIPSIRQLLDVSGCSCSVPELLRMERIVLKKLDWRLKHVTSIDFLHMFHSLMAVNCPGLLGMNQVGSSNLLIWLGVKLKSVLPYHKLAAFPPSTVALSLISLELELGCKKWLPLTIYLQNFAENNYSDFMMCRKQLSRIISRILGPTNVQNHFLKPSLLFIPVKRDVKKEHTDVEEIYDSIKHLYGEDEVMSCSAAAACDISQASDPQRTSVAAV